MYDHSIHVQFIVVGPDIPANREVSADILKFDYRIDGSNTDMGRFCGAFVWAEGFRKGFQVLNLAYWVGFSEVNIGGGHSRIREVPAGRCKGRARRQVVIAAYASHPGN